MAEKKLVLIGPKPEDEAFARAAAAVAEMTVVPYSSVEGAIDGLKAETPAGVMLSVDSETDYQTFEKTIQDTIGLFSETLHANRMHFISPLEVHQLAFLFKSPLFGNLIYRNYKDPQDAGKRYGAVLKASTQDRVFGLSALVRPGVKVQTVKLSVSSQKPEALEAVKNYLLSAKFNARMASLITNAVDELLLNAIYDAPTDDLGKQLYNRLARSTVLKLEGKAEVQMQLAFDGNQVAISVMDQFGSLDKEKLLTHMSKYYGDEAYQLKTTVAGAGLGLATVFRSGASFFFASENGLKTETTIFFKRTDSYKDFKEQFRFLSTQFYF